MPRRVYVVTDDPHGVLGRAEAAGARIVKPMAEEDYGSTGFTVADAEGNLWSFGTYRGVAALERPRHLCFENGDDGAGQRR